MPLHVRATAGLAGGQGQGGRALVARLLGTFVAGVLLASPVAAEVVFDAPSVALEVADDSGLTVEACDLDLARRLPTTFHYERSRGLGSATFASWVPARASELAALLRDPEGYPEWFLLRRSGEHNVHALHVDEAGRGYLQVAAPDGFRLDTTLTAFDRPGLEGVHLRLSAGASVLVGDLVLAARQGESCGEDRSLFVGSLTWRLGWLGRLLPASLKSLPGALALTIRDEVTGHLVLADSELAARLFEGVVRPGRLDPDRPLTLRPLVLEGSGRAPSSEGLEDFLEAVSGSYAVTRWLGTQPGESGEDLRFETGGAPFGYRYELDLVLERRGYDLQRLWRPAGVFAALSAE